MSSTPVYLVQGARTPILKARGAKGPFASAELATQAGRHLLNSANIPNTAIDETILGCVMPSEREANIGRIVSLRLGLPESTPAWTVQRNCASGLQAVDCALNRIQLGHAQLVLAGGVEAMSHAPIMFGDAYIQWLSGFMRARSLGQRIKRIAAFRPAMLTPVFALEHGLTDPVVSLNMGETAERIAERFGITRSQMDEYAVRSHLAASEALDSGVFENEITPIFDRTGKMYAVDDGVRADSNVEKLSTLKPAFCKPYGKVTAANSSQISDGAAWMLLASERALEEYQLTPMAKIRAVSWAGLDPAEMGLGPVHAIARLLKEQQLSLGDIDYFEINEAFAAQVLACRAAAESAEYCTDQGLWDGAMGEIPLDRLNVDGGAIASGHPVGMSGARIVHHLASTLQRKQAKLGVASLCIGGGQGGAALIESL